MKRFGWLKNDMKENMSEKLLSNICTNSLALSGFSFTSLAVFLGFYKDNLQQAATIIQLLTVATILFLISSELAREAVSVGGYLVSELFYFVSAVLVLYGFIDFMWKNASIFGYGLLPAIFAFTLFVGKITYSIYLFLKRVARGS